MSYAVSFTPYCINKGTKDRKGMGESIGKEDWKTHFCKWLEITEKKRNGEDGIVEKISENRGRQRVYRGGNRKTDKESKEDN